MIEVRDLSFSYPGADRPAIENLNFRIDRSEIFGFLGPSGAGKSTTQKIITGILKKYQGSVQVNGQEISGIKNDFFENIGVSFELPNLYNRFTARENLEFFAGLFEKDCEPALELLELVGLAEVADEPVKNFSKGMKMRLNLCRAFLNRPNILFLDEPTSGLDPMNRKNVRRLIMEKKDQGQTVFITTHDMLAADELCDRIAFIVDGRIEIIDSPRELKLRHGRKQVEVGYQNNGELVESHYDLKGLWGNQEFIELLKSDQIETIHSQEACLEDVFIAVTGRELR
ncbi:MAG: ABC transporter ATP-binding protein [Bacillota bacterium]